jgi:hypothetical protein
VVEYIDFRLGAQKLFERDITFSVNLRLYTVAKEMKVKYS